MTALERLALAVVVGLLAIAAAMATGYVLGQRAERAAEALRAAQDERDRQAYALEDTRRARRITVANQSALDTIAARAAALNTEAAHAHKPLAHCVANSAAHPRLPASAGADVVMPAGSAGPNDQAPPPRVLLSEHAVQLWDAALDPSLPAGPCGAANAATARCAAASAIDIDAAIANHIANAATCAANAQRLGALIEYLAARPENAALAQP